MISVLKADGVRENALLSEMQNRAGEVSAEVNARVAEMLSEIAQNGMSAVERYSKQFDKSAVYEISKKQLAEAYDTCPDAIRRALVRAAGNIRAYHEKMLVKSWEWEQENGARLGQRVAGLDRVGVYVPGGSAAYPSSVLMNVIPAKVAGVREVVMVTPPTENLNNTVLAAAKIAGVDRVFAIGGVQAIAALAYGVGEIPRVDKIVGPGNAYVAAAKRMVYGKVDLDMVAGPSEILIVADESANPTYVAADLLSQAEHDVLASSILLTTSEMLASAVHAEVERQLQALPRQEIAARSLRDFGAIIVCSDLDQACELANQIAPEHLEIMTDDPRALLPKLRNAGAIFLGAYSPEPLGDYMAGPCHVLPTSGTARFFSPLSTDSFLKKTSIIEFPKDALGELSTEIITLADAEGLSAHANSVKVRAGK